MKKGKVKYFSIWRGHSSEKEAVAARKLYEIFSFRVTLWCGAASF
jgi:hypothetical protein